MRECITRSKPCISWGQIPFDPNIVLFKHAIITIQKKTQKIKGDSDSDEIPNEILLRIVYNDCYNTIGNLINSVKETRQTK